MKKVTAIFIVLSIMGNLTAGAQSLTIPQPSTLQRIEQDFGLGKITVSYSRPNAKERKIFNGMEPYGIVWRTGANSATKIKFSDTVMVEGNPVAPGEYALFTIPGEKEWTIILNKTAEQWGAYSYDSTKDLLRFNVKPARLEKKLETFTIQFANTFTDNCDLQLLWENTVVSFHIQTDVDAQVMANIDEAMKAEKKPYYMAVIYYYNHNKDMNKALAWMNEADKLQVDAYNVKYWKARIELKLGNKDAAIKDANDGLTLAMAEPNAEYIRLNKEVLAAAKN